MNKHLSSLAVVGHSGELIGNLSMSDLKWILKNSKYGFLYGSVLKFVSYVDQQQGLESGRVLFIEIDF